MIQLTIIGTGAVAKNLYQAFTAAEKIQLQIIGRSIEALEYFSMAKTTTDFTRAQDASIVLLAVSDSAVAICEEAIGPTSAIVAHCAGSLSIDTLQAENAGVFYPLQTFNTKKTVSFENIPILIEATNTPTLKTLRTVANSISNDVRERSSADRRNAHLAAVFANNFSNYLFGVSKELLKEFNLEDDLLDELILQTAKNAVDFNPNSIQSGPAKRNDIDTIQRHLHLISDSNHKKLYLQLTNAIKEQYNEL